MNLSTGHTAGTGGGSEDVVMEEQILTFAWALWHIIDTQMQQETTPDVSRSSCFDLKGQAIFFYKVLTHHQIEIDARYKLSLFLLCKTHSTLSAWSMWEAE